MSISQYKEQQLRKQMLEAVEEAEEEEVIERIEDRKERYERLVQLQRSQRKRTAVSKYGSEEPSSKRPFITFEQVELEERYKVMKSLYEENKTTLRHQAHEHACPLKCAAAGLEWPPSTFSLTELLKVQPEQFGLADDGIKYDLKLIKKYIHNSMDRELVSPVTGEPMNGKVLFTKYGRSKKDPNHRKLGTFEWTPGINGSPDKEVRVRVDKGDVGA